jgi:hypothetical protein
MSVVEPGSAGAALFERAKNIILTPSAEWTRIDGETADGRRIFGGYVLPLAAISAACGVVGAVVFGYGGFGVSIRPSLIDALIGAVLGVVLSLSMIWIMSRIIDFLAPSFEGQKNSGKALQVAAYASTAGFAAGVFQLYPPLAILGILGLYSIFLLFRGLPILMKAPAAKAGGYTAAVVIVALVLGVILTSLVGCVTGVGRLGQFVAGGVSATAPGSKVTVETDGGKVNIDVGSAAGMAEAAKQLEKQLEAAGAGESGGVPENLIAVEELKTILPVSLPGGWSRTELATSSAGAMGFGGATASGTYTKGDGRLELVVADIGAIGAMASMASVMGAQATREDANGYERTRTVNGALVVEELDRAAKTASFMTLAERRFVISAEGTNVAEADVRAAVEAIPVTRLKAMAKVGQQP